MQQVVILRAQPRNLAYLGLAVNLLQSTLVSAANVPQVTIKQFTELPRPRLQRPVEQITQRSLISEVNTPIGKSTYPVYIPRKFVIITTIESSPFDDANIPVNILEWRNPQFNNNPATRNKTWINNNLQDTLTPIENAPFLPSTNLLLIKGRIRQDWIQSRPIHAVDQQPHNQKDWPNPILPKKLNPSWTETREQFPPPLGINFLPVAYPNPLYKGRLRPEFVYRAPYHQLLNVFPIGKSSHILPQSRLRRLPETWIQARPQYYIEPSLAILVTQVFDNPIRKTKRLIVKINTRFPQPANLNKPFNETMQWPNPVLRVKRAIPWDDHYIFDDSLPPIAQILSIPIRKKYIDASFVRSSQILVALSGTPIPVKDWPNPVRIKRSTLTEINNLLQHPFAIAPGNKPFFESKWPLPLRGKRIHHQGWIQETKKYYVEEPLQPNQYDWPLFRPLRRSDVGFAVPSLRDEVPRFVTAADVPLRKKVIAISFIENPILRLPDVEIIKPFAQYDWPVVVRVKRFIDFIKWIDLNLTTLPSIVGRIICLQMNDTEYFLEISVEDYDLEIRDTDYDIDIGGNECE